MDNSEGSVGLEELHRPQVARRWAILTVLCMSLVIVSLSNTSLNIALPTLSRSLQASPGGLQWIVDAYSMVFAGLLLTAGALGDRFGHRRALNAGLVVFAIASAWGALSGSVIDVILARGLMGVGAALIMPATLSILAHVFPPGERGKAIAIWAGVAGVGGATGLILTGWLLQHFWWGSIFFANVVVVIIALAAGARFIPSSTSRQHRRLDPIGALLSSVGLGVLVYAAIHAPVSGWLSLRTVVTATLAAALLGVFVAWELSVDEPMLDMHYFRNPTFAAACATITFIFFTMYGTIFVMTQYLQLVIGYSPLQAGLRIIPLPLAFMAAAPLSASLVSRFGQRAVVCTGMLVLAGGAVLLSRSSVHPDEILLTLGLGVMATGMGLTTAPSTTAIMNALPLASAGAGSAINDTTRELGGALGVAVLGSLLATIFKLEAPTAGGGPVPSLTAMLQSAANLGARQAASLELRSRQAFASAMDVTLLAAAATVLLASLVVFLLMKRPVPAKSEPRLRGGRRPRTAGPTAPGSKPEGAIAAIGAQARALDAIRPVLLDDRSEATRCELHESAEARAPAFATSGVGPTLAFSVVIEGGRRALDYRRAGTSRSMWARSSGVGSHSPAATFATT